MPESALPTPRGCFPALHPRLVILSRGFLGDPLSQQGTPPAPEEAGKTLDSLLHVYHLRLEGSEALLHHEEAAH